MGLLMLAVVFIVVNEQSNAHTNESVLARTNEFRHVHSHARMHAQTDQWLLRYSTSK